MTTSRQQKAAAGSSRNKKPAQPERLATILSSHASCSGRLRVGRYIRFDQAQKWLTHSPSSASFGDDRRQRPCCGRPVIPAGIGPRPRIHAREKSAGRDGEILRQMFPPWAAGCLQMRCAPRGKSQIDFDSEPRGFVVFFRPFWLLRPRPRRESTRNAEFFEMYFLGTMYPGRQAGARSNWQTIGVRANGLCVARLGRCQLSHLLLAPLSGYGYRT